MNLNAPYTRLSLYIDSNNIALVELYNNAAIKHNNKVTSDKYFDAGFDIFVNESIDIQANSYSKLDSKVIAVMEQIQPNSNNNDNLNNNDKTIPLSFYLYPRSSISKTPLRLANSVGIIDSGYRGNIIGAFHNMGDSDYKVINHTRLLQICSPTLSPFIVNIVTDFNAANMRMKTSRGEGGFGSTDLTTR
uniref:dUTPase-like domain-containing protein n=1 Tax=viral metagenome TaxID=1070528 RepID=A0A6C0JG05_9ZZZZ